jgi:glycosyltransferase involved in cell wall biosynthesis
MKPRLIVIGPLPPPYHGVTVSTSLVLSNSELRERFDVDHVDTSDHRSGANVGEWDVRNAQLALRALWRLLVRLRGRRGIVYLPLSQGTPGFLRDSAFIHASAAANWKVAVHLRGGEFDEFYDQRHRALRRWIQLTLARVDALAVMGESLRSIFTGLVADDRIAVIPNGTPDPSLDGAIRDPKLVLFLSNLRERKGVAQAVEAARIVLRDEPEARFLFVGEWESTELSRRLGQVPGERERISFAKAVSERERDKLFGSASVFLFPPVGPEGHPRVVLEALAAGLPVVTTNRGAIAETVVDGESGFVLDDPVPKQLAQRLLLLLRDEDLRARMSAAARRRYLEHFTQTHADQQLAGWLTRTAFTRTARHSLSG